VSHHGLPCRLKNNAQNLLIQVRNENPNSSQQLSDINGYSVNHEMENVPLDKMILGNFIQCHTQQLVQEATLPSCISQGVLKSFLRLQIDADKNPHGGNLARATKFSQVWPHPG